MRPFRGITTDSDWTFGQGQGSYFRNQRALVANLKTRLVFFLNDCFFAMNVGIDWWNLLGTRGVQAEAAIVLAVRQVVATSEGVTAINSVTTSLSSQRNLSLTVNIDTIYSRNITVPLDVPLGAS